MEITPQCLCSAKLLDSGTAQCLRPWLRISPPPAEGWTLLLWPLWEVWEWETHRLLQLWLWLPHLQSRGHTTFHFLVTIPPDHSVTTGASVFQEATVGFKVAVNLDCMGS